MAYTTLTQYPALNLVERLGAQSLVWTSAAAANVIGDWDARAVVSGSDPGALQHALYTFDARAGDAFDLDSLSRFDPQSLRLFDDKGAVIFVNDEADDPADTAIGGVLYAHDTINGWVAPYSGTFYVGASWTQGPVDTFYSLSINKFATPIATVQPGAPDGARISAAIDKVEILGTVGPDQLDGTSGADFIIAFDGDDVVFGAAGDDDLNGNVGSDRVYGGDGADTVRGGKDNDSIFGGAGADAHVNGNLGDDSVSGGDGNDTCYGGQGADTIYGDAGSDLLSGDQGDDLLVGGAGADVYRFRAGGGTDWVSGFNAAEGDRIALLPGQFYTVSENAGQAVINLQGGGSIGLIGVSVAQMGDFLIFG